MNSHDDVRVPVPSVPIGSALLVSNDPATIKPLGKSMQSLAISTEVCGDVATAPGVFNRRKFGAIVADLQLGDQAQTLLEKVRRSPSNRTSVIFAISDSDAETAVAFKDGSNFVLRRPLSESSTNQNLRAAYGLILREQRRYFRCPVDAPATLKYPGMQEVCGRVVNISEGGIAMYMHFINLWTVYTDLLSGHYVPRINLPSEKAFTEVRGTMMLILYAYCYSLIEDDDQGLNGFRIWRAYFPEEDNKPIITGKTKSAEDTPDDFGSGASLTRHGTRTCRIVCLSTDLTPGHQIFRPMFSRA